MSQDIIFAQSADLESILISEEELTAICDRIAREINEHYRPLVEAGEPLLVVGVLKGSVVFLASFCVPLPTVVPPPPAASSPSSTHLPPNSSPRRTFWSLRIFWTRATHSIRCSAF